MMKIKKDCNEKIVILFVAGLFLLNSSAYAISVSKKTYLRKSLDFNNPEVNAARYQDVLANLAARSFSAAFFALPVNVTTPLFVATEVLRALVER